MNINEEANGKQLDLANYTKSEFWKNIFAKKIITIGSPVEFQTVAYNLLPSITSGKTDVVSDKVANLEYKGEEKFTGATVKTFGEFANLMRSTGSWNKIDSNFHYLGIVVPVTIRFTEKYTEYKTGTDAEDVLVNVYQGDIKNEADFGKAVPANKHPIPVDVLFYGTFSSSRGNAQWHRRAKESVKVLYENIRKFNAGEANKTSEPIPMSQMVQDFKPVIQDNSYVMSFPFDAPKWKITMDKVTDDVLLNDVDNIIISSVEDVNVEKKIDGTELADLLYDKNKRKTDGEIVSEIASLLKSGEDEDEYVEVVGGERAGLLASVVLGSPRLYLEYQKTPGASLVGSKDKDGRFWTYTTATNKIKYIIRFEYSAGEALKSEQTITIYDENGKDYTPKTGVFFSDDFILIYKTRSGKNFKLKWCVPLATWWKAVVATLGQDKRNIKEKSVGSAKWKNYWAKQNFIQEDNSDYWKKYWNDMLG